MRKNIIKGVLAVWMGTLIMGCQQGHEGHSGQTAEDDGLPALVTQVKQCSRLYTTEYKVHKIVTHDDVIKLQGSVLSQKFNLTVPLGERKIAIPMDATLKAYIDLNDFSEKNVERQGDRITLILPDPKVVMTASKIDQQGIRQYVALARTNFSDREMTLYEQQGRAAIINSIPELGMVETARENAARILIPLLTRLGYQEENITIAYRKEFNSNDLLRLLEP